MSAALLSGGVKEGNNFIVLFLDFNLDFSLYDTLCAGDRAVDAQFSCKTRCFLPPLVGFLSGPDLSTTQSHLSPLVAASPAKPRGLSCALSGQWNLLRAATEFSICL